MTTSLTPNAIISLNSGDVDLQPLLQVLDVKQIGSGQSVQERYRLVLSDGNYVQQAMLATQLNDLVRSGEVQKGSIVKLVEYICNTVQQRKIIIVLNMIVVVPLSEIIGDPKQVIMNDQTLNAAASASGMQQNKQASSQLKQPPEAFGGVASHQINGGNKPGQLPFLQENAANVYSLHAQPSKTMQPVGYQGQALSSFGGAVQTSGSGTHSSFSGNPYGRPVTAPSSHQVAPLYSNQGPIVKNEAPARIVPIAALNPYQGRWTIKARVTLKGGLRRYHNAKGEGKVFSFDLLDAGGGEIRVTCFNNVADQFYERIEAGNVYMISKGSLKPAQRNFNHLKSDWEILLESSSTIERCCDEDGVIPQQQFDFRSISEIENMEANAMVDVVGVVVTINPSTTVMRKTGTEVQKRSLQLRDISGCSVEVTMWGAFCSNEGQQLQEMCDSGNAPILAIKGGRLSDFGGKSIGTVSSTQLLINPNLSQAFQVKDWFEKVGKNTAALPISKDGAGSAPRIDTRKTIAQIKDEGLGRSDKPDWIVLRASVSFIKTENFCYTACPLPVGDRQCNKKVINNGDGTWRCDRCDRAIADCDYRYLLSLQAQDHTGMTWLTAFQEAGEEIIGVSAKELYTWKQDDDPRYKDLLQKIVLSRYLFKLKVKEENYNDELRVKCTVIKSEKIDYVAESRVLIDMIGKIARGEPVSAPSPGMGGYSTGPLMPPNYGGDAMYAAPAGHANGNNLSRGYGQGEFHVNGMSRNDVKARNWDGERSVGQDANALGGSMRNTNACFKCGQGGHWARDCPGQSSGGGGGNNGSYGGYSSFGGNGSYAGGYGGHGNYSGNSVYGRAF